MNRHGWLVAAVLAAGLMVGGCNQEFQGSSRSLGTTDYTAAFATANEVISQYYPVESADPARGVIQCRVKDVKAANERLLGGSPARELATMKIVKEGKDVMAYVTVALQRQGGDVFRAMPHVDENYSGVPNRTPAEQEAATTTEQNEPWRIYSYNHQAELKILEDLARAVGPKSPATAPAPAAAPAPTPAPAPAAATAPAKGEKAEK
jgi:hypothetical protein